MLGRGQPCVFFEDKVLYTRPMYLGGVVDAVWRYELVDVGGDQVARVFAVDDEPDWVVLAPGGLAERAVDALRALLIEEEILGELLIPSRLYPLDIEPLLPLLRRAGRICVVEDGTPGGSWGETLAQAIHTRLWGELAAPVRLVTAAASVIPTARHLEQRVLVQDTTIRDALVEVKW